MVSPPTTQLWAAACRRVPRRSETAGVHSHANRVSCDPFFACSQAFEGKVMSTIQGASASTATIDAQYSVASGLILQVTGAMKFRVSIASPRFSALTTTA